MRTTLQARLHKAEHSVRLALIVREWETLTAPVAVEWLFQEAAERMPFVLLRTK